MSECIGINQTNREHETLNSEHDVPESEWTAYVLRLKLAVAVAVIRATPEGLSPKEFAESLVITFSNNSSSWKRKCSNLEETVFVLERRLETMEILKKVQVFCPGYYDCQQENPFPAERGENPVSVSIPNFKETLDFVRSFILLESVTTSFYRTPDESSENTNELIIKSVSRLFEYLRSGEGLKMEFDLVRKALEEVHRLFDVRFGKFNPDLLNVCLTFVDGLLVDIYQTLEINKMDEQHRRSSMIQMVAEHRSLTILIMCRLLREITVTSDFLADLFHESNENLLPLLQADNAYYVLQSLEGILNIMHVQRSPLNALKVPEALMAEWDKTTGKSLSLLGSHFPMYCIYVWHLKSSMKVIFSNETMEE